jgi:hypothetical protein
MRNSESFLKLIKILIYKRNSNKAWYSFARSLRSRITRPAIKYLQRILSSVTSKIGITLIWDMFGAASLFQENRFLVLRGFNGLTFLGKKFYISRKNFCYGYRELDLFQHSIENIIDTTGENLTPITFIESALASEGTFKVKRRFLFRMVERTHLVGVEGSKIIIPSGYLHFGHFVPQLLPFLLRRSPQSFALDLPIPDDVNLNTEILHYFGIQSQFNPTVYRSFRLVRVAFQSNLYPANSELKMLQNLYFKSFSDRNFVRANKKVRLYLTRKDAPLGRQVLNENELLKQIEIHGFLIVDPSNLSFAQASELFANAEIVVGPAGSAFFHAFGMTQGSILIDFQGDKFIRWHLRKMSMALGLRNITVICECNEKLDLTVDIPLVVKVIEDALLSLREGRE